MSKQTVNEHLFKRLQEAEDLMDRVLNWALANRNTKSEFVSCYTYSDSLPQTLVDVKKFLGEKPGRPRVKVVKDRGVRESKRK